MKIAVRHSGVTSPVVRLHVHSGTTKQAERAWIRQGGALKKIMGAFSVDISADPSGYGYSKSPVAVTTNAVAVSVTGAIGAISYAWTRTDGGGHSWTINSPSSSSTTFTTTVSATVPQTATFQCTVIDSVGQTQSVSTDASCSNNYFGGGFG